MNCIEKLMHLACEPCVVHAKIIEFKELYLH
jgi:hypothetical protein